MVYEMKLAAGPFDKIVSRMKTVELRLFDKKRRQLDIGDKIIFKSIENPAQCIAVTVKSLHRYATFEDLFMDISPIKCGSDSYVTPEEAAFEMGRYYTRDQIRRYGVLGIGITITDTSAALEELTEEKEAEFDRLFPDGMK